MDRPHIPGPPSYPRSLCFRWTTGHDLLIEHKCMTRDMIRRIVSGAKLYLRCIGWNLRTN